MAALRYASWAPLVALAILGCAAASGSRAELTPGAGFYDAAQLDDPSVGRCDWLGRSAPFVFQESDYIRGYFEPTNLAAYKQSLPKPFAMPERPLIRVSFLDFYEMAEGPTYRETEVAVLGMEGTQPGWVVLTLPVTNGPACIGGRSLFGLAKVMRKITFERAAERYVGTQYLRGGENPEITLTVDIGEPDAGARDLLRQYGSYPQFGLLQGRVLKFGGSGTSYAELAARGDYQVKLGKARLVYATAPDSLLQRLGVGEARAAHWSRIRARYTIKPR